MKISDLKYIFPRIKYSTHTPKLGEYPEGYFINRTSIKPTNLESSPIKDMIISNPHAGCGHKMII